MEVKSKNKALHVLRKTGILGPLRIPARFQRIDKLEPDVSSKEQPE